MSSLRKSRKAGLRGAPAIQPSAFSGALGVLLVLVLVNVGVWRFTGEANREHANLAESAGGLSESTDEARHAKERADALRALIASAQIHTDSADPRDFGSLRDRILAAERGLAVQRTSLDFRPADNVSRGFGGARVQLSMRGPVDALFTYLSRLEATGLALAPETLTLRQDGDDIALASRWTARWPLASTSETASLSDEQMETLAAWLEPADPPRSARLGRDPFSFVVAHAPAPEPHVETPRVAGMEPRPSAIEHVPPELPVLTGFVLARPEVEPNVRRRVLAALRYEDEVRLVMVGDALGDYMVEGMEARESVTLKRSATGERIRLTLP